MRPGNSARFVREAIIVGFGAEVEDEVMMEVIGLSFVRRDAVNVDADKASWLSTKQDTRLFDHFAAGGPPERLILLGDMPAGQ